LKTLRNGESKKNKTQLLENYIDFGITYYTTLYALTSKKGIGYQGLIYREAVGN
jgi:hypothetical protein